MDLFGFGFSLLTCGLCGAPWIIIAILLAVYTYTDATKRNFNPILWTVLVVVFGLIPFIIYLLIRPPLPTVQYAPPPGQVYQPQQQGYQVQYNRPPPPPGY
ncbi:MAG: hypothetical protein QW728_05230 [Thermoplasmata archaeon]